MKAIRRMMIPIILCLVILALFSVVSAEESEPTILDHAFLALTDASGVRQSGSDITNDGVHVISADITGPGVYTVGLDFSGTEQGSITGLSFAAISIANGEVTMPGCFIVLHEVRINDDVMTLLTNGYTTSDGDSSVMPLYAPSSVLSDNARCYNGAIGTASGVVIDPSEYDHITRIEATFSIIDHPEDLAYISFASADWSVSSWTSLSSGSVTVTTDTITGPGVYSTRIDTAAPFDGIIYLALNIEHGEQSFPCCTMEILSISANGQSIPFTKGYTTSDDGITTYLSIYNEFDTNLTDAARSFDGSLDDVSSVIVDPADFPAAISSIEITFSLTTTVPDNEPA